MTPLRRQAARLGLAAMMLTLASACRPDAGASDYASQEPFGAEGSGDGGPTNALAGPDPWTPGEDRLSIGTFYEGGSSDLVPIDDATTHLYVYENTLRLQPVTTRVEGLEATAIEHAGGPWWGCGVHWDLARDMGAWTTLHVSLRSDVAAFAELELGMNDADGTYTVQASAYGWAPDDTWHHLAIPLTDFDDAGLSRDRVTAVLVLLGGPGANGDPLLIDNVYFTAAAP